MVQNQKYGEIVYKNCPKCSCMIAVKLINRNNESKTIKSLENTSLNSSDSQNNDKNKCCFQICKKRKKRDKLAKLTNNCSCQTNQINITTTETQASSVLYERNTQTNPYVDNVTLPKDLLQNLITIKSSDNEFDNLKSFIVNESLINRRNIEELVNNLDRQYREIRELNELFGYFIKLTRDNLLKQNLAQGDNRRYCDIPTKSRNFSMAHKENYKTTSTNTSKTTIVKQASPTVKQPFYRRWYQSIIEQCKKCKE